MTTFRMRFENGTTIVTLPEIVEINNRILSTAAIQKGVVTYLDLTSVQRQLMDFIHWDKLSLKDLIGAGFKHWKGNVYLAPRHLWNLIPEGTKIIDIKAGKVIKKCDYTDISEEIMGYLHYGFHRSA